LNSWVFFGAIVTALALGYTQIKRGHVGIDIVVNQFSKKTQRILNGAKLFHLHDLLCTCGLADRQVGYNPLEKQGKSQKH